MKSKIYVFLIAFVYLNIANAQNFANPTASTGYNSTIPGLKQGSLAPIDFNSDGKIDLIMSGYDALFNSFTRIYQNTGSTFTNVSSSIPLPGSGRGKTAVGDVNNDGRPDILIVGEKTSPSSTLIAKLFTNSGTNFTEVLGTPFAGVYDGDAAFADVNNDGFLDVLIIGDLTANNGTNSAKLYTNSGTNFSEVQGTPFTGVKIGSIAFADVNNDTFQDVIISGLASTSNPITKLYTNSGTNFTEVLGTPFPAVSGSKVAFFDANGDAKQDLFISGMDNATNSVSKLFTNSGTNFIEVPTPAITPLNSGELLIADFNNDNKPDIYLSGSFDLFSNSIKLYTNTGGNFAEAANTPFESDFSETIAVAFDINNDGKKDIFASGGATGSGDNLAKIYFNIANTQITAQPVSATVCGGTFHTIGVTATGTGLTYKWSNGATTQSINTTVAGTYKVTVSGLGGVAVSNSANLVVNAATQITKQPISQVICSGQRATLSVSGTGLNISYLWNNGATTSTIQTSTSGNYFATVSGVCGSIVSNTAITSVATVTTITGVSPSTAVVSGSSTTISVTATGASLSYLWSNGATTQSITVNQANRYTVTVTGTCGRAISQEIFVGNIVEASSMSGYTFQSSFGTKGDNVNEFGLIEAMCVSPDGKIYISDYYNHRISVWTLNGGTYTHFATFGSWGYENNEFFYPTGITISSDGKIYVADYGNDRMSVWTLNNNTYTPFATFGSPGQGNNELLGPISVTTNSDGKIYVTDHLNSRISVWTNNGSIYTPFATFGSFGQNNNQFNYPSDVSIRPDGKIIVTDIYNHRISVWTLNGNTYSHHSIFGSQGSAAHQFINPTRTRTSQDGKLYVTDGGNNRISVWTQSGNNFGNLTTFGSYGSRNGEFSFPSCVDFVDKNTVLVSDYGNNRISIWKVPAPIFYQAVVFNVTAPTTFTGNTATLTWPTIPGVSTYCIRISKDRTLNSGVKTVCGLSGNSYSYNPNNPNARELAGLEDYYWQVIGVDSAGNYSQWSETQNFALDANSTSVSDLASSNVEIYPNPLSGDILMVENAKQGAQITITNIQGKVMISQKAGAGIHQLDVSSLQNGVYIVKVGSKTLKLIRQ